MTLTDPPLPVDSDVALPEWQWVGMPRQAHLIPSVSRIHMKTR